MNVPRRGAVGKAMAVARPEARASRPFAVVVGKARLQHPASTWPDGGLGAKEKPPTVLAPTPKEPKEPEIGPEREGVPRLREEPTDWLDPGARHLAQLAPIGGPAVEVASNGSEAPLRGRSLEELLPALVKRIAWAGDRHRGTVRLELGAGAHAGTTVLVHAEGGRVRVEVGGAPEPELESLRARLDARLRAHGLDVESVT